MTVKHIAAHRDIGPIGTASRAVVGLIAIAVPIAVEGIGWWDAATALIAFPLLATLAARLVTAAGERHAPAGPTRRSAIHRSVGCSLFAVMIAATIIVGALTPVQGDVAFWAWLGASMLLAAARGYGGCEVLAFANALTGRRSRSAACSSPPSTPPRLATGRRTDLVSPARS